MGGIQIRAPTSQWVCLCCVSKKSLFWDCTANTEYLRLYGRFRIEKWPYAIENVWYRWSKCSNSSDFYRRVRVKLAMTAGLRRLDVHFDFSRVTINVQNATTFPQSPTSHPPSHDHSGPEQSSYFARSLNSSVVVVMGVLLFALIAAAFINTIARCLLRRRQTQPSDDHNEREKGLDKSVIEALPVVAYSPDSIKSSFDPSGENDCVVCLSGFVEGEKVRLLPHCKHGFHLVCIDTWLLSHTTCPVCRRSVHPAETCSESDTDASLTPPTLEISSRSGNARNANTDVEIVEPSAHQRVTS